MEDEIDNVLHSYMATISEKDEDIFKLYADNKRLHALLEESLHTQSDLEKKHQAVSLIATSQKVQLEETERRRHACERENKNLRTVVVRVRELLDLPKESNHDWQDTVQATQELVHDRTLLKMHKQHAQDEDERRCQSSFQALLMEEDSHRESIVNAATGSLAVRSFTFSMGVLRHFHDVQLENKRTLAVCSLARETEEERYALELKHLHVEWRKAQRCLNELEVLRNNLEEQLHRKESECSLLKCMGSCCLSAAGDIISLLSQRCWEGEQGWTLVALEQRRVLHRLCMLETEKKATEEALHALQSQGEQDRTTIRRLRHEAQVGEGFKNQAEKLRAQLTVVKEENATMRTKWLAHSAKERAARQLWEKTVRDLQARLADTGAWSNSLSKNMERLKEKYEAGVIESKLQRKHARVLEQRVNELQEAASLLEETQRQAKMWEEQHAQDKLQLQALQNRLNCQQREREAVVEYQQSRMAESLRACERAYEAKLSELQIEIRTALAASDQLFARERTNTAAELRSWVTLTESLKSKLSRAEQDVSQERAARLVLEQQHEAETRMTKKLLAQMAEISAARELLEAQKNQYEQSVKKDRVLEEACRRSATVIAELREALHRERQSVKR